MKKALVSLLPLPSEIFLPLSIPLPSSSLSLSLKTTSPLHPHKNVVRPVFTGERRKGRGRAQAVGIQIVGHWLRSVVRMEGPGMQVIPAGKMMFVP